MEIPYSDITIGVIGGVLAATVVMFFVEVYQKVIIPFMKKLLYSGIYIQGKWETKSEYEYASERILLDVNQSAQSLFGSVTIVKKFSGISYKDTSNEEIISAKLKGNINDRFVRISLVFKDNRRLGFGSYLLEVIADGSVMRGVGVWYDTGFSEIRSRNVQFQRHEKEKYYTNKKFPKKQRFIESREASYVDKEQRTN